MSGDDEYERSMDNSATKLFFTAAGIIVLLALLIAGVVGLVMLFVNMNNESEQSLVISEGECPSDKMQFISTDGAERVTVRWARGAECITIERGMQ
jgi:hypothetical protein